MVIIGSKNPPSFIASVTRETGCGDLVYFRRAAATGYLYSSSQRKRLVYTTSGKRDTEILCEMETKGDEQRFGGFLIGSTTPHNLNFF